MGLKVGWEFNAFILGVAIEKGSFAQMDSTLKHPFTCVIAGPTQSGKTQFSKRLILAEENTQRNLVVIDDLMSESGNNAKVTDLFTKGSHHRNLSVILILQNLFYKGKEMRTISLNAHYMVLFKNPRDASQISHLARQMYPSKPKYMMEAYRDATSAPYGYLFVDLKPDTPENMRLRTNIFPGEYQVVYVAKV